MQYLLALGTFMGIHFLGMASPGASFINTLRASTQNRPAIAIFHALGLGCAAMIWALAVVLGLQTVLLSVPGLFRTLQIFGGCYLAFIAFNAWRHANDPAREIDLSKAPSTTRFALFRRGILTNLSNPKVMIFFASVFAGVLRPDWPLWVRAAAVLLVFTNEFTYYSALTLLLSTRRAQHAYRNAKPIIDRITGTALGLFAIRMFYRVFAAK